MRPLGVTSVVSGVLGILVAGIAQLSIPTVIANTRGLNVPDLSQPALWTGIGWALIGVGVLALILELLMVEVREAIRSKGALRERVEAWSVSGQQAAAEAPTAGEPAA